MLKNYNVSSLVTVAHVAIILRNLAYKVLVPNAPSTMACALLLQLVNGSYDDQKDKLHESYNNGFFLIRFFVCNDMVNVCV